VGEACVPADVFNTIQKTHVCKSVPMVMDLNLLDTCIFQFVSGPESVNPSATNECSANDLLKSMLDRNSDGAFNIFDVDSCIADFLDLHSLPCDEDTQTCENGQVYCDFDEDCGVGSFCDEDLMFCRRECGFVVNRAEPSKLEPEVLDRPCYGRLKTCDYSLGKCVKVDLATCPPEAPDCHACQVDAQCPSGAYCFVGKCTAKCNSALDCPDANWYCSNTNTCLPRPKDTGATAPFNPKNYSILLAEREVSFSVTQKSLDIPVLIMDLAERKPVFGNSNVVFGYRLETRYGRKQDPECGDLTGKPPEVIADCLISPDEEFVTMENPFGVIYGEGSPRFRLSLNMMAFDKLSPGLYEARFTAMFNNGDMDTIKVMVRKPTPSGDYFGQLSVYLDNEKLLLGQGSVSAKLFVDTNPDKPMVEWDKLLEDNNLEADRDYVDVTRGYPVRGYINGNTGMLFDNPQAEEPGENKVALQGIYSPHLGRLRLIAVMDMPGNYCMDENGVCPQTPDPKRLKVKNPFGRRVERIAEFIGPFNPLDGLFQGHYRERVSGLLHETITLSGDFRLALMTQDATDIPSNKLRAQKEAVGFVDENTLLNLIDADIALHCKDYPVEQGRFQKQSDYSNYLAGLPATRVFPRLQQMSGLVGSALQTLNNSGKAYLTLNEFLAGRAGFCRTGIAADSCVDKIATQCGLALYRKAFVTHSWVSLSDMGQEKHSLFCDDGSDVADCELSPAANPAVVTLHEHNRFYRQLVETYAFEAGNALSDAFYVMYKAAAGSKLGASSAFDYKMQKLVEALDRHDEVRSALYSPQATAAMAQWPMASFVGGGNDWLDYLEVASTDRMTTVLELLDMKRRVQDTLDPKAVAFASHLLHDEYLVQVMLLALREKWQGLSMNYTGTGPQMMEQGDLVLAKVSQARNPLGLHENRVYFQNSNLGISSWENYRERVNERLDKLDGATNVAIQALRDSLFDKDSLENDLQVTIRDAELQIDELCGAADSYSEKGCDAVTEQERKLQLTCDPEIDKDCTATWVCDKASGRSEKDCDTVAKVFDDGVSIADQACRVDTEKRFLFFGGKLRQCTRGRMGALIQERKSLQLQKEAVMRRFNLLMRQIAREQQYIKDVSSANEDLLLEMKIQQTVAVAIMEGMTAAEVAMGVAEAVYKGLQAGDAAIAATGTVSAGAVAWGIANGIYEGAMGQAKIELENARAAGAAFRAKHENAKEALILRKNLDDLMDQVELLLIDYDSVVQHIVNVTLQMDDTQFLARQAAKRHAEEVGSIVNRLIGRESGSVLVRNKMVMEANQRFQDVLVETYKLAQALVHRYNLGPQSRGLVNKVYRFQTGADIRNYIEKLDRMTMDYCDDKRCDPDYVNNTELFRLSLRDALFPNLRDIVDAKTGKTLTKGQQFHNIITTSPQFIRRYKVSGDFNAVRTQIVLPFTISVQNHGSSSDPRNMVSEGQCNHILVNRQNSGAISGGTIAVNVQGDDFKKDHIWYQLVRGGTDYIRSCEEAEPRSGEPKVNVYSVSAHGKSATDDPAGFLTVSNQFKACWNENSIEDKCYVNFARDRSLGAPDWKFVITKLDLDENQDEKGQKWILGEGIPPGQNKPYITDIVLYFRYNARPIH
jgi:hypothetical protein